MGKKRALVLLLLVALPIFATTTSSSLTGTVVSQGMPAPGVTVTVTSKSLLHERTTITGANGTYWLDSLPPGMYDVTFSRAGLQTLTRRAVVELARVARADAALEPSEEGENITSTATTMNVNETVAISTHFPDRSLDRLPIRRDPLHAMQIAPGALPSPDALVDHAQSFASDTYGEESIEQITILRGALPVEYERFPGTVAIARTRSGGEDFSLSVRDTITEGATHFFETASGGRVVPERLWFFASGWSGDSAGRAIEDEHGYLLKLTGQIGAGHSLAGAWKDSERTLPFFEDSEDSALSLSWTGVIGPHLTFDAVASRADHHSVPGDFTDDALFARGSYFHHSGRTGDHVLRAGFRATELAAAETRTLFVADRWSLRKLTVDFGVRHESGSVNGSRLTPRLAATYDLAGNGRHAIAASYSEYNDPLHAGFVIEEASAGYAAVIGSSGSIRVDVLRHTFEHGAADGAQADFTYRLFDRLEAGANYTWYHLEDVDVSGIPEHSANAWIGADLAIGEHLFGFTVLERFDRAIATGQDDFLATDVALRYTVPFPRFALTLATDVANVFDQEGGDFPPGRAARLWLRLRV